MDSPGSDAEAGYNQVMRVFGLIPAAGLSRRMGRPKLALPLGDGTILERVVSAVRAGGVTEVVVVIGPSTAFLQPLAERAGAVAHVLNHDTPDMRATIQAGLQFLQQTRHPDPDDAWLLLPADHPTLAPAVIDALRAAAGANPSMAIFVPIHAGRRGHPALLRWRTVDDLRQWPADQGLNAFIRAQAASTHEIAWPGADVLRDLDTPEDYERLIYPASRTEVRPR